VFFKLGLYLDEAAIALDLAEQWPPKRSFGLIGPEGEFGGPVPYSAIPAAVNVRFGSEADAKPGWPGISVLGSAYGQKRSFRSTGSML
jgi:hypothetical protein